MHLGKEDACKKYVRTLTFVSLVGFGESTVVPTGFREKGIIVHTPTGPPRRGGWPKAPDASLCFLEAWLFEGGGAVDGRFRPPSWPTGVPWAPQSALRQANVNDPSMMARRWTAGRLRALDELYLGAAIAKQ